MAPYEGILTSKQLIREREAMEINLQPYFNQYNFTKKKFIVPRNKTTAYLQHFLREAQGIVSMLDVL